MRSTDNMDKEVMISYIHAATGMVVLLAYLLSYVLLFLNEFSIYVAGRIFDAKVQCMCHRMVPRGQQDASGYTRLWHNGSGLITKEV